VPCLGITGGVATGKSSFSKALSRLIPARVFDADQCSRELLTHDLGVKLEVRRHFGDDVFTPDGEPDRTRIREIVFGDSAMRKALEAILHPRIREKWTSLASASKGRRDWFIVDIPLLFETRSEENFDEIFVVACSAGTQIGRMVQTRGLDKEIASRMIASQLELKSKMQKAGHVIWNDGPLACMEEQAALAADYLKKYHG
jgi:dephospho-CoA kinase